MTNYSSPYYHLLGYILLIICLSALPLNADEVTFSGIGQCAEEVSSQIAGYYPNAIRIGILPVSNLTEKAENSALCTGITSLLHEKISGHQTITVVEQEKLDKLLEAVELQLTGLYDMDTVVQVGNLAGAQALLYPELIAAGNALRLSYRLVDLETSEILLSSGADLSTGETNSILKMLQGPAYRLRAGVSYQHIPAISSHTLGGNLGFNYTINNLHRLSLNTNIGYTAFFASGFDSPVSSFSNASYTYEIFFYPKYIDFDSGISYGLKISAGKFWSIVPEIGAGYICLGYDSLLDYYNYDTTSSAYNHNFRWYTSPYGEIAVSFESQGAGPTGFFVRPAFRYYLNEFENSISYDAMSDTINEQLWGFQISTGMTFYF